MSTRGGGLGGSSQAAETLLIKFAASEACVSFLPYPAYFACPLPPGGLA